MLKGSRIAVLESRTGERLCDLVARQGGVPLWAPALAEVPSVDPVELQSVLDLWAGERSPVVVLQTGVGVSALFDACEGLGGAAQLLELLARSLVVVRGPKPTAVLRGRGVRIDLAAQPPHTTAEVLAALGSELLGGRAVFVQRYGESNTELEHALTQRGARVSELVTYQWALPADTAPLGRLLEALQGELDAVVFTSRSQLENLLAFAAARDQLARVLQALRGLAVFSIGPVCTAALLRQGIPVRAEATPPKLGPLMSALERELGSSAPQAIVLFAHGARDPQWAQPFEEIRRRVTVRRPELQVVLAFLDLMGPSLPECMSDLVARGVTRVRLVPLFLGRGGHLKEDLARLLEAIAEAHPGLVVDLLPALGEMPELLEAVSQWAAR